MTVESVRINQQTSQRVLILKATEQERYLFIWIAHAEAYAIALELQGTSSPRPLTHDLFIDLVSACDMKIVNCVISDLVDDIFYSYIEVEMAGRHIRVDARPSDSIAIACELKYPSMLRKGYWTIRASPWSIAILAMRAASNRVRTRKKIPSRHLEYSIRKTWTGLICSPSRPGKS